MTKSRFFLFLLLVFIVGILVRSFIAVPYFLLLLFWLASAVFMAVGAMRTNKMFIVSGFLLAVFAVGIFRFDQVVKKVPDPLVLGNHTFRGVMYGESKRNKKSQELHVAVYEVDEIKKEKFNALLVSSKYPEYAVGDEVLFSGEMKKPENFADFDYVSYLKGKDILVIMPFPVIEKTGEGRGNSVRLALSRIKTKVERKIDELFRDPYGALLKGLLLGERSQLPEKFLEALHITGTTHIVALSGYNITLVGAFMLSILLGLTIHFRIAFWTASSFVVLFVIMTGASASVVRAGIMGLLVLIAQNEGREYRMANALVFAAAAMIFYNPLVLRFDAGFQLSFLATYGILYLPPRIAPAVLRVKSFFYKKKPKSLEKDFHPGVVESTLVETISAQCFVLPLLLYLFGTVSFISPLVNIMVLLVVPFAMGFGFLAVVSGFLYTPLAEVISWVAWFLLSYIVSVIEWFSHIPYASFEAGFVPWYVPVFAYCAILVWIGKTKNNTYPSP